MRRLMDFLRLVTALAVWEATASEEPEVLLLEDGAVPMLSTPLESLFSGTNRQPAAWSNAITLLHSTNCTRRYVGTWVVREEFLWLQDLRFCNGSLLIPLNAGIVPITPAHPAASPVSLLLPGRQLPLRADWFSGVVRIPQGTRIWESGFDSVFESDRFLKIEQGRVVAGQTLESVENRRLYRSNEDLERAAAGGAPRGGEGALGDPFAPGTPLAVGAEWIDGRTIRSEGFCVATEGASFRTRGILVIDNDRLFGRRHRLWIPPTPLTPEEWLPLASVPSDAGVADGSHVEVVAALGEAKDGRGLRVSELRALRRDESIHHPDFRLSKAAVVAALKVRAHGPPCPPRTIDRTRWISPSKFATEHDFFLSLGRRVKMDGVQIGFIGSIGSTEQGLSSHHHTYDLSIATGSPRDVVDRLECALNLRLIETGCHPGGGGWTEFGALYTYSSEDVWGQYGIEVVPRGAAYRLFIVITEGR